MSSAENTPSPLLVELPERRRAPRAHFYGPVIIRFGRLKILCRGNNLSESGMRALSIKRNRFLLGKRVRVHFTLPGCSGWIAIDAKILRQDHVDGYPALGMQFVHSFPKVRRLLRTFVFTGHARLLDYCPTQR
jgi:hypothetical protein